MVYFTNCINIFLFLLTNICALKLNINYCQTQILQGKYIYRISIILYLNDQLHASLKAGRKLRRGEGKGSVINEKKLLLKLFFRWPLSSSGERLRP